MRYEEGRKGKEGIGKMRRNRRVGMRRDEENRKYVTFVVLFEFFVRY